LAGGGGAWATATAEALAGRGGEVALARGARERDDCDKYEENT
jgi:hypothetical protein